MYRPRRSRRPARYGPVDLDPRAGTVTPIVEALGPLNRLEEFALRLEEGDKLIGAATTTRAAPDSRATRAAARAVAPVAKPSSTMIATRPASGSPGRPPR